MLEMSIPTSFLKNHRVKEVVRSLNKKKKGQNGVK